MGWQEDFGRQIKEAREGRGWSQDDLAAGLSVSRPQLSNYEHGKNAITAKVAAELAVKLNQPLRIDSCEIVPGKSTKAPPPENQLCLDFDKEYRFGPVTIRPSKDSITVTTTVTVQRSA